VSAITSVNLQGWDGDRFVHGDGRGWGSVSVRVQTSSTEELLNW